jgi:hypothetical protein
MKVEFDFHLWRRVHRCASMRFIHAIISGDGGTGSLQSHPATPPEIITAAMIHFHPRAVILGRVSGMDASRGGGAGYRRCT